MKKILSLQLITCLLSCSICKSQQLIADSVFAAGATASGTIFRSQTQPNGSILLAGSFSTYNGYTSKGIVRILPNGSRDASFNAGTGIDTRINKIKILPNGKIIAGGAFSVYNGNAVGNIVRLMSDGSVDGSFQTGTGLNNEVLAMDITPDSGLIVAGFFSKYQGQSVTQPIKILSNGQRDLLFNPGGTGLTSGTIADAICVQSDGKIIIGGTFTLYNGVSAPKLVRLHADGSRDTTFNIGTGFTGGHVNDVCLQADGKILVGGSFTSFRGASTNRMIRLHADGSRDFSFDLGAGMSGNVKHISSLADGNIIAAGDFVSVNGTPVNRVALLSEHGRLISGISNCTGTNGTVYTVSETQDSAVIIGGAFSQVAGRSAGRISKLAIMPGNADQPQIAIIPATAMNVLTTLVRSSGNLNGAAHWSWYNNSCGMGYVGSGDSLRVSSSFSGTYFLRGEGSCVGAGYCGTVTIVARPDTLVWTGSISDRWEDPSNWSPAAVPDSSTTIIIHPHAERYPVIRSNVTCGRISLNSQSTIRVASGFLLEVMKVE